MTEVWIERDGADLLLHIKAVPGASRDEVAGVLGDRLKVRTSAAPEGGKANRAICKLLADQSGLPSQQFSIERGGTSPQKTVRIAGAASTADHIIAQLTGR